jgi:hypothetical protein
VEAPAIFLRAQIIPIPSTGLQPCSISRAPCSSTAPSCPLLSDSSISAHCQADHQSQALASAL